MDAQPLADEAAQRQSKEMHVGDLERIEQFEHISPQPIERIGSRRRIGAAMAAKIIAQHAEGFGEFRQRAISPAHCVLAKNHVRRDGKHNEHAR